MNEQTKLKYWLDSELSFNHIYYLIIIGILLGGKWWFPIGFLILINLRYAVRRAWALGRVDRNYLKLPRKNS